MWVSLVSFFFLSLSLAASIPPHIIYLVIDDYGWANFAPHRANFTKGNEEFPTPNLAALANEGMLLDRMYGHKFCGPSRASIQTGRNPIHVSVLDSALDAYNLKDPVSGFMGIPRNMTGIATKLKGANYSSHMVGKWCVFAHPTLLNNVLINKMESIASRN